MLGRRCDRLAPDDEGRVPPDPPNPRTEAQRRDGTGHAHLGERTRVRVVPDSYTGDVTPGGPSDVRRLPDVQIRKASVSAMDNNAYLVTDGATGTQLLVDAADDAPRLLALVAEGMPDGGTGLATVVTTHRHWDHHRALADV